MSFSSVFSQINGLTVKICDLLGWLLNGMLKMLLFQRHHSFLLTGRIDHSAKLLRVITWNRSHTPEDDGADKDEFETHATVLDKMLAWEKKLYDELKVKWICFLILVLVFQFHGPLEVLLQKHYILYILCKYMWDYMDKFSLCFADVSEVFYVKQGFSLS